MTPARTRIARLRLEPLSEYQQRLQSLQPLAEALADRMLATLCLGGDIYGPTDAMSVLYHRILQAKSGYARETEDEKRGSELSAERDAALMFGIALGRRLGPQAQKGGA